MKKINVGKLITGKRILENKTLCLDKGKIVKIEEFDGTSDLIAIPGFIDIHNHGGYGMDYVNTDLSSYEDLQKKQASEGITSMLATVATSSLTKLNDSLVKISSYIEKENQHGAKILGIHMEGPFLSPLHLGVMDKNSMISVDLDLTKKWIKDAKGHIKLMTLAPELDNSDKLLELLNEHRIISSAGHSNASSEDINEAIGHGLSQVTHMFNAMRPLHHRELGILGESLTNDYLYSEMAGCDECSIDPAIWKMAFKLKTPHKMILTTDAMILKGLPNGKYNLSGREIEMIDGVVFTDYHGATRLPGKPMTFIENVRNVMKNTGATLEDIVLMSSVNPAKRLKIDDNKGYLEINYDADINILDKDNNLLYTYVEGILQ